LDFDEVDADDDGQITLAEYETYLSDQSEHPEEAEASEEEEEEASDVEALTDLLYAMAADEDDSAEIEELIDALQESSKEDVVSYVLARPTVYPFAYRSLVKWGKRYPKYAKWFTKVRVHRKRHPGPLPARKVRPAKPGAKPPKAGAKPPKPAGAGPRPPRGPRP
jgi:hypothetical protein